MGAGHSFAFSFSFAFTQSSMVHILPYAVVYLIVPHSVVFFNSICHKIPLANNSSAKGIFRYGLNYPSSVKFSTPTPASAQKMGSPPELAAVVAK